MDWIETTAERRGDPRALWPEVRSVDHARAQLRAGRRSAGVLERRERGAISVYAQRRRLSRGDQAAAEALARWLVAQAGGDVKVFVDTAAVMEKPLAAAAGLGWQGKHTNLVSREFGSWLFLGAIFTTLDLPPDEPERGSLRHLPRLPRRLPDRGFPAPYRLDARRCISYLTIEHKGQIPREFRAAIGNRIYGCDDCLAVCPWNKFAQAGPRGEARRARGLRAPPLAELARARRRGVPRAVRQTAGQAHRPRPLRPQRADRDRQFGRRGAGARRRALL